MARLETGPDPGSMPGLSEEKGIHGIGERRVPEMLIEEKSLKDITAQDIEALLGAKERGRLEFKRSVPTDNLELLRDVCSMANADGGLIIVGAETAGEICTGFVDVIDPDGSAQRIRQTVLDGIEARILDFGVRTLHLPTGMTVLVVYVPSSFSKPHMVKKNQKTEFWKRYETDKRAMTLSEIRLAFADTSGTMMLGRIEEKIDRLYQQTSEKTAVEQERRLATNRSQLHQVSNIAVLMEAVDKEFEKELGPRRALRLTITPTPLVGELVDPSDKSMKQFLQEPPNQRYAGWNMAPFGNVRTTSQGFETEKPLERELILLRNGHFEFRTEIDSHFSWKQDPQEFKTHPLLYPLPVTEYPVSFLRLAKELYARLRYSGRLFWRMRYYNIKGCQLRPYHPQAIGYSLRDAKYFEENHLFVQGNLESDYDPDSSALKLIQELYYSVGFTREHIPFFDESGLLSIPAG